MREKQILFSTEMVRAILDGRKTMTRRIVKGTALEWLKPNMFIPEFVANPDNKLSPYRIGDILYVRETWAKELSDKQDESHPFRDEEYNAEYATGEDYEFYGYVYRADTPDAKYPCNYPDDYEGAPTWHPSIHMPKEAARIWLEVTDVRVERLQEITEDDMIAEGVRDGNEYLVKSPPDPYPESDERYLGWIGWNRACFEGLWNSTIKKQDRPLYCWDTNPWVWVYGLKRLEGYR